MVLNIINHDQHVSFYLCILPPNNGEKQWKLKDCCTIIIGKSDNSALSYPDGNSLPFVRISDFGNTFPTITQYSSQATQVAEKDDILLITTGAKAGSTNLATSQLAIGSGIIAIRPSSILHSHYVLFFLKSKESQLASEAIGTTVKRIVINTIKEIDIPILALSEQKSMTEQLMQSALKIESLKLEITKEENKLNTIIKDTFK